jgi:hypothetical protein
MDILVSIFVFVGIYLLFSVFLLSPFMLSAQISRQEEDKN